MNTYFDTHKSKRFSLMMKKNMIVDFDSSKEALNATQKISAHCQEAYFKKNLQKSQL